MWLSSIDANQMNLDLYHRQRLAHCLYLNQDSKHVISPTSVARSTHNNVVRKLDLATYQVTTIAGPGKSEDPRGTNGAGTAMKLVQPQALALTPDGSGVVIADASNTIRIVVVSGTGEYEMATGRFNFCSICPAGTVAKVAGSDVCEACEANAYSPPGADTCTPCPRGAICPDGIECSLRNQGINCTGQANWAIVGTWEQNNSTNLFELISCPAGFELIDSLDALQECKQCGSSE